MIKLLFLKWRAATLRADLLNAAQRRSDALAAAGKINAWMQAEQKRLADLNGEIHRIESGTAAILDRAAT